MKSIRFTAAVAFMMVYVALGFAQSGALIAKYSATTANTSSPGETVRFDLLRWSTDMEREQLFNAVDTGGDTALPALLQRAPTIGYIWTSESAGYSLRYAYRVAAADGGERIILATDRPLGLWQPQRWKLAGTLKPMEYTFTVIELRVSKAGIGEGKASLAAKVIADKAAKTITLENFATAPVLFQNIKK